MIGRASLGTLGAVLVLATALAVPQARAERLIVSVSNHRVTVTPNYSGEELVLFGSVEKDAATPGGRTSYDLVVTVSGPRADMVTRRKERKFGIWINTDYRQFLQVPSYLALFANRPFDAIAPPEVERRQQLGLNNVLLTQRVGPDYADVVPNDPFRSAFVRLRSEHGLYREDTSAVTFLTPTLFRTGIPLPAAVPIGTYNVEIKLFSHGALVTRTETAFEIVKVGFEHTLSENPAISIGTRRVAGLGLVVRRLVGRVHRSDRRIVAFVSLEDRTAALRRSQRPLDVVAIRALLDQRPARSDRFKIEAISDLCGRTNLN